MARPAAKKSAASAAERGAGRYPELTARLTAVLPRFWKNRTGRSAGMLHVSLRALRRRPQRLPVPLPLTTVRDAGG